MKQQWTRPRKRAACATVAAGVLVTVAATTAEPIVHHVEPVTQGSLAQYVVWEGLPPHTPEEPLLPMLTYAAGMAVASGTATADRYVVELAALPPHAAEQYLSPTTADSGASIAGSNTRVGQISVDAVIAEPNPDAA